MNQDQKLEEILNQVDMRVGKELAQMGLMEEREGKYHSLTEGVCHTFWNKKKQILREEYGIDWRSPQDLNPDTLYD